MTFQYRHKEEVIFSEILLPSNAPAAYADRETLWNAVQEKENRANSQVARQFIIAMPKEWTHEESISRAREFLQKNLVDAGMVVDWAFHENGKESQNAHQFYIHIDLNKKQIGFSQKSHDYQLPILRMLTGTPAEK